MSGLEVIGAIAAVSQITVYVGRLVQHLADMRRDLENAFDKFTERELQIEQLAQTLHSLRDYPWLPDQVVCLSLKPIEERIDAIRGISSRWASKQARRSGLKSIFASKSLHKAHKQIEANFRDLDGLKTTLILHISAWNSSTLYKIHHLSESHKNTLETLNLDNSCDLNASELDMNKLNQWFKMERNNVDNMDNKPNSTRLRKKITATESKNSQAQLEVVENRLKDRVEGRVEDIINGVDTEVKNILDKAQVREALVQSEQPELAIGKDTGDDLKAQNVMESKGVFRAKLKNNEVKGRENKNITTGARLQRQDGNNNIEIENCGVEGDNNSEVTTGLVIDRQ